MLSCLELLALALALSLDAFAVAASTGCALPVIRPAQYLRLCAAFGFFQFIMPVIGWHLGAAVHIWIERWDHWLAFGLLAWIGWNLIRSSASEEGGDAGEAGEGGNPAADPTAGRNLLVLALATSIDALAAGLSLSLMGVPVWGASLLIGVVCAVLTGCGLFLGHRLAAARTFGRWAGVVGGCALFGIGVNILFEHGVFG